MVTKITELPPMRLALWGEEKSWKTSLALSFPKPLKHFDIDIGGFNRASWANMPIPRIDLEGIESTSYHVPISLEKMLSSAQGKATIRFPKSVKGYKEVWQQILLDFVDAIRLPFEDCKTIVLDSGTELWRCTHTAYLQEKQEIQLAKGIKPEDDLFREKLKSVEYPNDRMFQFIYAAQGVNKNLVLTHYPRDKYAKMPNAKGEMEDQKTGELELDGFKHTGKVVDILIQTELKTRKVGGNTEYYGAAKVSNCGYPGLGTTAIGWELPSPDYQGIIDLYKLINGIEEE